MPIYTFLCNECGERFDILIGVTIKKEELKCRKCNSTNIEKIFGTFSMGSSDIKSSGTDSTCPTGTCPLE